MTERRLNSLLEELKQIDWTKNILFLMLFILVVSLFFILFVRPALSEFKQKNIEYRKALFLHNQAKNELDARAAQKKDFLEKNNKILDSFDEKYNEERLLRFLGNYFLSVVIKEKSDSNDSEYVQKILRIEATMESPTKFNEMLNNINNFGSIVKVEFPVTFSAYEGKIKSEFVLKHYLAKKGEKG